jgi:AcrR family transcriptional regulator
MPTRRLSQAHVNPEDPRVKRTRKLLRDAVFSLLRVKSFDSITVQDIAEQATVNRATFYAHYSDKHALFDDIVRRDFHDALQKALAPTSGHTSVGLRILCRTVFAYMAEVQDHCRPSDQLFNPLFDRAVQEVLSTFLQTWLAKMPAANKRRGANLATASMVLSWAIFGAGAQWSRSPRTMSADEFATQVVSLLSNVIAGSATEAGSERLDQVASSEPGARDPAVAP